MTCASYSLGHIINNYIAREFASVVTKNLPGNICTVAIAIASAYNKDILLMYKSASYKG